MAKLKSKLFNDIYDSDSIYDLDQAIEIVKKASHVKFDESVELAINLNVDPRHAEENIRVSTSLPNGTGKKVVLLVLAQGEKVQEALDAGADYCGNKEYLDKIKGGWVDVDKIIATPDMMAELGKLGKILGPKGLMPNPKSGTVTDKIGEAVKNAKSGQVRFKTDKGGTIHGCIGKVSYSPTQLEENTKVLIDEVKKLKPASAKGVYIKNVSLSSTMGPGVKLDTSNIL